jgi:hypothetical protein
MGRVLASLTVALCLAALPAQAATFVATSASDIGDWAPGDGSCDSSPIAGVTICTLRAAVQEANALPGADVIQLLAQTYTLTLAGDDDTAAAGDLDANTTIRIEGAGMGATIVHQDAAAGVFQLPFTGGGDLTLADLTVRGGDVGTGFGGGIAVVAGSLALERVEVTGNAARIGGGIFNAGSLRIEGSWIHGNQAEWRPGGIASASTSASGNPSTTLVMESSTVGPNTAELFPKELELSNGGSATLTNVTITHADPLEATVEVSSEDVVFDHVTLRGELTTYSFTGTDTLVFSNSAIEYCNTLPTPQPITTRSGVNASANAGCSFAAAGGIEGPFALGALADNGGPTPTHLPLVPSAWVDAIDSCALATDQRGVARPIGPGCDVGAVEAPEPGAALASVGALFALALRAAAFPSARRA